MNRQVFLKPDNVYRGVALWMLNDRLEVDQILRQLDELAAAGWGAVIARTFNGLRTRYLGDEWMEIIGRIIERSEQLNIKVWLQAGYMPSAMPGLDASRAHRGVTIRKRGEAVEFDQPPLAVDAEHAYYEEVSGTVLDLLDRDAVIDYLNVAYRDPWYSRFSRHFGKTIEAIWVDEPHFRPPLLPWSRRLPDIFREQWGYDLREHLPSLFKPVGDYHKIRHHYWRCVLGLFLEGYFKPVGEWCGKHGVKFSGHLMGEDTLNNQIGWTGATMPCYEFMHLPGIDHLTGSLQWPTGKPFILTPKQATSAANQLGKTEVLAEMYGVSSQGISFADRKQIADWMMVLGINYRCYHGAFYSMRGRRKRIYVPHLSYQQPWWPDNRLIADPFARLSWALRQGQSLVRVLVLHPVESTFCLYDPTAMSRPHNRDDEPADVRDMDTRLVQLCRNLLGIRRDFDFGDETLLARHGQAEADGLRVGKMVYPVVILPELLTVRLTTLELLERFVAAGGAVFSTGALPTRIDGIESPDVQRRLQAIVRPIDPDFASLDRAIEAVEPAPVRIVATSGQAVDVWAQVRRVDEGKLVYLVNTNSAAGVSGALRLRGHGALEEWDLSTGEVSPVENVPGDDVLELPLDLAPLQSRLLLVREDRTSPAATRGQWRTTRRVPLTGRGRIQRDSPNVLTLDRCRWRRGEEAWNAPLAPHLIQKQLEAEKYTGPVALQFQFETRIELPELKAVIEDAAHYTILVNGQPASYEEAPYYIDRAFHPVSIGKMVRPGTNTIELSCDFTPVGRPSFGLADLFENREGTELESIYLIGDFAVTGTVSNGPERAGCVRFAPDFTLTAESKHSDGKPDIEGYPFYAGKFAWVETVSLRAPTTDERVVLELTGLNAALAHVRINGKDAGALLWPPYQVEIGHHLVEGENEIRIELVSSLRNLLGPHHRACGEITHTWHNGFDCPPDHGKSYPGVSESTWTDDYMVTHFRVASAAVLSYQSPDPIARAI